MRCPWLRQRDSPPLVSPLLLWRLFTLATEAVSLTLRATHAEFLAVAEHELLVWYLRSWPPSDAVQVAQLIDSNYYDWRRLWEARDEEAARQRELLPLAEDTRLHPTIFSVSKLQRCSLWRKALLRPGQLYRGRLGLDTFNPRHFTFVHRQLLLDSMRAQYPLIGEQYDGYIDDSLTDQMSGRESAAVSTAPSATSKSWSASPFSWQRYMLEGMNSHEQSKLLASGWIIFDGDHLPEHLLVCKGNAVSLRTFLRQQLLPTLPRDLWPVQLIRMLAYQQRLGSSSSRLRGRFSSFICALQAVIREDVGMTKLSELAMQWQEFCGPLSTRKARATEVDSHSQLISKIIHQLRSLYEVRIAAVTSQEGSQSSAIASWEAPHILATIIDVLSPHLEACTAFTLFDHLVWVLETGQAQGVMERPLQQMITRVNCLFWEAEGDIPRQSLLSFRASHQSRWREQRFLKWQRDNRSVAMANYRSLPLVQPPSHHRWPVISGLRYALIGRFGRGRVELNMLIDEHQALTPRFEPQIRVDGLLKDLIDFVYSTPGVLFDEQRRWLAEKDWPTFVLLVRALRWSLVNGWHLDMTPFPDRNSLHTFSLAQAQVAFLDHSAPSHDLNTKLETRDSVHAMSMAKVFCRELGSIIERVGWTFIYDRLHQDPHM